MKFKIAILSAVFLFFAQGSFAAEEAGGYSVELNKINSSAFKKFAILQVLDKTTAKTSILRIAAKDKQEFGRITIKVNRCWQAPLDQKPDSRILLEIFENDKKIDEMGEKSDVEKRIFYGWMISSSPSISSLEHPVYDVIAVNCKNE